MSRRPGRRGRVGGGLPFRPWLSIPGAVGWWDASRGLVLSGSNVVTVADQAAPGVADTLTGQPGLEPQFVANNGGYPCFDFLNSRLFTCPDSSDLSATAGFSVGAWVKRANIGGTDVIWSQYDAFQRRIFIALGATNNFQTEVNNIGTGAALYGTSIGWNHIAWVFDGALPAASRIQIYLNGVAIATTCVNVPAALLDTSSQLIVGALDTSGAFAFDGLMDSVFAYSRALTIAEINAIKSYHPHA